MLKRTNFACIQHPFVTDASKSACTVCGSDLVDSTQSGANDKKYCQLGFVFSCLVGAGIMLVGLIILNLPQLRDPLYEWPGEMPSIWIEWGLATIALWLAYLVYRGHQITRDPYSHPGAWYLVISAVLLGYVLSLVPMLIPESIPLTLRGTTGGIVVLYKTITMFAVCALIVRWLELWLTRHTHWQVDSHGALNQWWSPRQYISLFLGLIAIGAVVTLFVTTKSDGKLFAISAALSVLIIVGPYAFTLAARLPAKIASHKALLIGAAVPSSDWMLNPAIFQPNSELQSQRAITVLKPTNELSDNLVRLSRSASSIAVQNWWLVLVVNTVLLALATGLLRPWVDFVVTPSKAAALQLLLVFLVSLNSLRLRLFRER